MESIIKKHFALVAKINSIRVLLSLAISLDWSFYQLDVKNTFLNGDFVSLPFSAVLEFLFPCRLFLYNCRVSSWKETAEVWCILSFLLICLEMMRALRDLNNLIKMLGCAYWYLGHLFYVLLCSVSFLLMKRFFSFKN